MSRPTLPRYTTRNWPSYNQDSHCLAAQCIDPQRGSLSLSCRYETGSPVTVLFAG
ncbi:hypothetical protein [Pseudogemmobacter humi]|uniref:hypothetical protein n=1 Tax=Pseudogemmobacter humi TaxID=2483812 RepID=UPI00135B9A71|nr:hypothetical protein [Pseudogemmobacter humi]